MKDARNIGLKVALFYVILGVIWVFSTDYLSMMLSKSNLQLYAVFQQYKAWLFIFLTGLALWGAVTASARKYYLSISELKWKDEQYRSLFNHNPDAVAELDMYGNLIALNPAGKEILGGADNLCGRPASSVLDGDFEKPREYFQAALKGGTMTFETSVRNRLGEHRQMKCTLLPSRARDKTVGAYIIAKDITDIRRDEERMIQSEKLSVIGHLAAAVAHEIRNPLTSLKGFVQLMSAAKKADEHHLQIMLNEIERINIISSELLILGKKQEVRFKEQDLHLLLKQVITLMEIQASLDNLKLTFFTDHQNPYIVFGDDIQLKQILINIIKNSFEAVNAEGVVTISLSKTDTEAVIVIEDNGYGMEPEIIEKIGVPFYSTKERGTGIGLAVCQKIIQRHKGKMIFKSEKNVGTAVTITIPLADK